MPDKESTSLLGLQEGVPPEGGGGVTPRLSTCRAEGALSPHGVLTVTPRCTERFRYALRETQRNRVTCGWAGDQGPRGQPPRGRRGHARAHPSLTGGQVLGRRGRRKAGDVGHVRVFSVFPLSTPPIGCVEVKRSIFRDGGEQRTSQDSQGGCRGHRDPRVHLTLKGGLNRTVRVREGRDPAGRPDQRPRVTEQVTAGSWRPWPPSP